MGHRLADVLAMLCSVVLLCSRMAPHKHALNGFDVSSYTANPRQKTSCLLPFCTSATEMRPGLVRNTSNKSILLFVLCDLEKNSKQVKMVDRDWSECNGELDANSHDARTPAALSELEPEAEQSPEEEEDSKQLVSGIFCTSDRHNWVVDETRSSVGRKRLWPWRQLAAAALHEINGAAAMPQHSLLKHAQPVDVFNTKDFLSCSQRLSVSKACSTSNVASANSWRGEGVWRSGRSLWGARPALDLRHPR